MTVEHRPGGLTSAQVAARLHPGYVSGRYYAAPGLVQVRIVDATVANSLRAHPFFIYSAITLDRLALRVNTGAAGNAKAGIYAADPAQVGLPGALVAEVNADMSTASPGDIEAGFSANPVLAAGVYWFATCTDATPTLTTISAANTNGFEAILGATAVAGALNTAAGTKASGFVRTAALTYVASTAFFPATFGAGTLLASNPGAPSVAMRIL